MKLYTIEEIAELLSVSIQTIRKLIHSKKIKSIKIGSQYRVKQSDYEEYIKG